MNPRIKAVEYRDKYRLMLTFESGELKEFNLLPYLHYPVYESLKDESFCSKARVFNGTVVWDDTIDFDPDTMYLESKSLATSGL
jgi:hypothetical protein